MSDVSYYDSECVTIHCGDNCEVLATFPCECVDLVVTSPPYDDLRAYGGHSWDFQCVASELCRVLKPGGVIVWVVDDQTIDGSETGNSMRQALHFIDLGLRLHDTMIFETDKPPSSENRYQRCFEYMFVFSNGKPAAFNRLVVASKQSGRISGATHRQRDGSLVESFRASKVGAEKTRTSIWYFPTGGKHECDHSHPAVFPDALAADHILSWSNEGDTVLDPFNGSGTTTKMARKLGRVGIGIEINQEYCDIAVLRLQQRFLDFDG